MSRKKKKQRIELTKDEAAQVMFASNSICCVCKIKKRSFEIHHIDDNPANNDFDNLAVLCKECHSDAHTTQAFSRNLTPELIRLHNSSWRRMVRLKLEPGVEDPEKIELLSEALLEASLSCHDWKNTFLTLSGPDLPGGQSEQVVDVWDAMEQFWLPEYSEETYTHFLPLFTNAIDKIQKRFDRLVQTFSDVLPYGFRAQLFRGQKHLEVEGGSYLLDRQFILLTPNEERTVHFRARFIGVISVLREIAREADHRRENLSNPDIDKAAENEDVEIHE